MRDWQLHHPRLNLTPFLLILIVLILSPPVSIASQRGDGVRGVDFRNFTYDVGGQQIRLRNGTWIPVDPSESIMQATLAVVKYADFDGDGKEDAAVEISLLINGTMGASEEYFIYAYRLGQPKMIFHESREKGVQLKVLGKSLVIESPFWWDRDAHCCPSAILSETYIGRRSKIERSVRKIRAFPPATPTVRKPPPEDTGDRAWDTFWRKFRAAVKARNKAAIKAMASTSFEGGTETVSEWLRRLDQENHWYMVENALNTGTSAYREYGTGRPARSTRDHQFYFIYENHRWRFDGPSPPE